MSRAISFDGIARRWITDSQISRLALFVGCLALVLVWQCIHNIACAEEGGPVKVGVLTDASSGYAALSGTGSFEAAKMAAEDVGGSLLGKPIEVVFADHQNKADIGGSIAREWFDEQGVDVIADLINSSVALGVQSIAREKNKIALFSAATSSDLSGKACSQNGFQWGLDAYSLAHGLAEALIAAGGNTWFFITSDYAAGQAVEREIRKVLDARKVQVMGGVRFPLNTPDFSSFLLQAQSSQAKVIAATSGGADTINMLKQAIEFNIPAGRSEAGANELLYHGHECSWASGRAGHPLHDSVLLRRIGCQPAVGQAVFRQNWKNADLEPSHDL